MKILPSLRTSAIEILESRIAPAVDLLLTLVDAPDPVIAGTNLTYTIHLENDGDTAAANVSLSDSLPAGSTFVSLTGPAGWILTTPPVGGTGSISGSKASVAANESGDFTLVVHVAANVAAGTTISDTASITTSSVDTNPSNNTATSTTDVVTQADLAITVIDLVDPVASGSNLQYTLLVTNNGPSDAQAVNLVDAIQAGTSAVGFSQTSGPAFSLGFNGTAFTGTLSTMAAGASATFQMVVQVLPNSSGNSVINQSTISSTTIDPNSGNDVDFEATDVQRIYAFGVDTSNQLLRFDTAVPGTILSSTAITGLLPGENVLGIDFRPGANGNRNLYALGSAGRLYTIDTTTGAASFVASLAADPTDATSPFTALNGTQFGVDFNPVPDRLRVVSDTGQNLRINVDTGLVITDGNLNPGTPSVVGTAYNNSFAGATTTTLYDIDSASDQLLIQNPPNNGTLVVVGALGVNAQGLLGFDLRSNNAALAVMTTNGIGSGLYSINLTTGAATLVGSVGPAATLLRDLAIAPEGFVCTVSGDTATFVGGFTSDRLALDQSGGLLRHNRFGIDPGFNSGFDFDSTILGDQTLSATTGANIVVHGGDGDDAVIMGTAAAPGEHLAVQLEFHGGDGEDSLAYQNGAGDAEKHSYQLSANGLVRDGTSIIAFDEALDSLTLVTGPGNDTIKESGFGGYAIIDPGSGANKVSGGDAVVNGKTFSFIDHDGDRAKLSVSKGELSLGDFTFALNATSTGLQLQSINLSDDGTEFAGANVTLTASKRAAGDGQAHLGFLNAAGIDLGRVSIRGDLGKILAGDTSTDTLGVSALTANSVGLFGLVTQGGLGDLTSEINGGLGRWKVAGDFVDAAFNVSGGAGGSIQSISIGGDLIGGVATFSGSITASAEIGSVTIRGDVVGGDGTFTAYVQTLALGKVSVGGDLIGGAGIFSGYFQSLGDCGPFSVGGDFIGGSNTFAGYVQVLGALSRLDIRGDVMGGAGLFSAYIQASAGIGDVRIGGDLIGGSGNFSGYLQSLANLGNVRIGGSIIGMSIADAASLNTSGVIGSIGRTASITLGGSLIAGSDASTGTLTTSGAIVAGDDIGPVKIGGDILGQPSNPALIIARGQDSKPTTGFDTAIASLSVKGDVRYARILGGFAAGQNPANADASIGAVTVGGSWKASSLVAGAMDSGATGFGVGDSLQTVDNTPLIARIASITIKATVIGTSDTADHFGFVAQQIDKVKLGGRSISLAAGPTNDNILLPLVNDVHILEV
jgi:uncharacterized repeat protein (TIGR01451 family)